MYTYLNSILTLSRSKQQEITHRCSSVSILLAKFNLFLRTDKSWCSTGKIGRSSSVKIKYFIYGYWFLMPIWFGLCHKGYTPITCISMRVQNISSLLYYMNTFFQVFWKCEDKNTQWGCWMKLTSVEGVDNFSIVFDIIWRDQHDTQSFLHGTSSSATSVDVILTKVQM